MAEKARIVEIVKDYPTNLRAAFRVAGTELGRDSISIERLWYRSLRFENRVFGLTSRKDNVKNIPNIDNPEYKEKLAVKLITRRTILKKKKASTNQIAAINQALRALRRS